MTTKRLAILLVVVLGGLSSIFALPQQLGFQPFGINLEMPEYLGHWWGRTVDVSQKERDVLGHDTQFARRIYESGFGDQIQASIVLSGQDMMTSIHRPERCLFAQGWTLGDASVREIQVPGYGKVEAMRMVNTKRHVETGTTIQSICYYWFVGHTRQVARHEERAWLDSKDRLIHGYNQKWGMVMITAEITKNQQRFGKDEKATDEFLQDFIRQLAPSIHLESVKRT